MFLEVMDPDLHELLHEHDCTHLYFTHRWFLIDFKRGELVATCGDILS